MASKTKDTGEQDTDMEDVTTGDEGDTDNGKETNSDTQEEETGEGVKLTEAFQQEVHELCSSATKAECSYMRDCAYEREEELRKEANKKENKGKNPTKFSEADMPSM